MSEGKLKIILNMDPGIDDLFNLVCLSNYVKNDKIELLACTVTLGNTSIKNAFMNTLMMLELLKIKIPIAVHKKIAHSSEKSSDDLFGDDGSGGALNDYKTKYGKYNYYEKSFNDAPDADDLIAECIIQNPHQIILVATGPLNGISSMITTHGVEIIHKLRELVIMGGAFNVSGNISLASEYNIWFDPASAKNVFNSCKTITVIPLNVTDQLKIDYVDFAKYCKFDVEQDQDEDKTLLKNYIVMMAKHLTLGTLSYKDISTIGFKIHDASTFLYLIYPELFIFRRAYTFVECLQESVNYGKTSIDTRLAKNIYGGNTWYASDLNLKKAQEIFYHEIFIGVNELKRIIQ
jgi:inosine-uridine nucleoside N-ribohydrolase